MTENKTIEANTTFKIPEDIFLAGSDFSAVVIALIALRQSTSVDIETTFNDVPVRITIDDNLPKIWTRYRSQLHKQKQASPDAPLAS